MNMKCFSITQVTGTQARKGKRRGTSQRLYGPVEFEARPRAKDGVYLWRFVRSFGPRYWSSYTPYGPEPDQYEAAEGLPFIPYVKHNLELQLSPTEMLALAAEGVP
jgi:hypothetical protein